MPRPAMSHRKTLILFVAIAFAALSACDDDDDSAPLTVGAPPPTQEDFGDHKASDQDSEDQDQHPPDAVYDDPLSSADIPEGTDEQQTKFIRARTAFLDNRHDEAEELFEELALQEPVSSQTLSSAIALAQIYVETGRAEEAEELFDDLLVHAGELPEVLLVLGRVYAGLDKPKMALGAFDRAYEQQQDYIFILPEMAELLLREGEEEKTAQILLRYEERLEKMVEKLEDLEETPDRTRLYLVDILGVVHDEAAHEALESALAHDPVATIRAEAAVSLGELGAFEARDTLEKAAVDDDAEAVRRAARHGLERLRELEAAAPTQ